MGNISPEFIFIICCVSPDGIDPQLYETMHVFTVNDGEKGNIEGGSGSSGDPEMDAIAELYGANEIVRFFYDIISFIIIDT